MEQTMIPHVSQTVRSTFIGGVERITYFNAETGQCVFKLKPETGGDLISVSCRKAWIYPGLMVKAAPEDIRIENGMWRVRNLQLSVPRTERNLRKFLKSEAMSGVGPKLARAVAKAFPTEFFDVLESFPDRLLDVPWLGSK